VRPAYSDGSVGFSGSGEDQEALRLLTAHEDSGAVLKSSGGSVEYNDGGKVGALRALFRRKPKADQNAKLRKINAVLEQALYRPPRPAPRSPSAEELNRDVAELRREVGAQGGDTRPLNRAQGGGVSSPLRAIQNALAHLDKGDTGSALQVLKASPEVLRDPGVARAMQKLRPAGPEVELKKGGKVRSPEAIAARARRLLQD
jgi:hypothetical protein